MAAEVSLDFMPFMREQNDLRRLAFFEPGFNFEGFVVTAVCSLEPGLARRYDATPFLFKPPSGSFPALRCHAGVASEMNCENRFMDIPQKNKSGIAAAPIYDYQFPPLRLGKVFLYPLPQPPRIAL